MARKSNCFIRRETYKKLLTRGSFAAFFNSISVWHIYDKILSPITTSRGLSSTLKVVNEVNAFPITFSSRSLFLSSVYRRKTPRKDAILWRLCAWMKFSCSIKSARERRSPLLCDLFICLVVFFSRATKRAYIPLVLCSELTEDVLFNARVSGSSYFDISILSRTVVDFPPRPRPFCARIFAKRYKRNTRLCIYAICGNNTEDKGGIRIQLCGSHRDKWAQ